MAITGHVVRKPMQRDLFTGELTKQPKRGNGSHIALKRDADEPKKAVGMAHFPGTGPDGLLCQDCASCGDLPRSRQWKLLASEKAPGFDRLEVSACRKAAQILGTVQRGGIQFNRSCKYFEAR